MKIQWCRVALVCLTLSGTVGFADEGVPAGLMLEKARVLAQTCDLQINIALASIEKHLSGFNADKEICFDMGQLTSYLKDLDLAVDLAREDLLKEPWETRYWFRWPFRERDTLLGACGIVGDTTMPVGDFAELRNRLLKYKANLAKITQ